MRTRRHALGQNFLHHRPTIEKIAALVESELQNLSDLGAKKAKCLLEVGPGKLALTNALIPCARSRNLPVVLVERDRYLEESLREELDADTALHFFDAATDRLPELIDSLKRDGQAPIFFASNLPYSAASQIIANLCHRSQDLIGAVVMVQKEMAARMTAGPGTSDRGAFSLLVQSYFEAKAAFDVSPGAFTPAPKVMSTVLTLRPLPKPLTSDLENPLKFEHFCKMLFSQRRKMIRNLIPSEKHELFPKLGISGTERSECLKLETILELYRGCST